jgi:hypothetical protein
MSRKGVKSRNGVKRIKRCDEQKKKIVLFSNTSSRARLNQPDWISCGSVGTGEGAGTRHQQQRAMVSTLF